MSEAVHSKVAERPSSMFGQYFQARHALQDAVTVMITSPRSPDVERVLDCFNRYVACHRDTPASALLDRFMVLINENCKQKGYHIDPLVLFSLRFGIASRLAMRE